MDEKGPFNTQSFSHTAGWEYPPVLEPVWDIGTFSFVQIMSREQTVAMETVVSDAAECGHTN